MCVRSLATNLPVKLANSMSELPRRRSTAKALASPVMDASHAYNQSLSFNGLSQLDESKSLSEAMLIDHAALAEKKAVSAEVCFIYCHLGFNIELISFHTVAA
jgi:hypothetical protein